MKSVLLSLFLMITMSFWQTAQAQVCIELEGMNIGCISSQDHGCYKNVMIDKEESSCRYVADYATQYRVDGPLAFQCKSYRTTTVCPDNCTNPDGCGGCVTSSECIEYLPPNCKETCIGCYRRTQVVKVGISRGCLVCTRDRCDDEVEVRNLCPTHMGEMYVSSSPQCSSESRCPSTAVDPLGVSHNVNVNTDSSCPEDPGEPKKNLDPPPPQHCIWKEDPKRASCDDPVPERFLNPKAKVNQ